MRGVPLGLRGFVGSRLALRPLVAGSLFATLLLAPGCVRYRPAPVSPPSLALATTAPPRGPLAYDDAVRHAVLHNPTLRALRARAEAVNLEPPAGPIGVGVERDMDGRVASSLSFDVLSLLGVGPRQAERALARARRSEAALTHLEEARKVAGDLAEVFAVQRALADLLPPDEAPDPRAFVDAGLEVAASERVAAAVGQARQAELAEREALRRMLRAAAARLLGARPDQAPELALAAPISPAWPEVPAASWPAVVAARADLQRLLAAYETADAELRRAVAGQVPTIEVEPGLASDPTKAFGMVRLHLPVGADREAVAAEAAREAAREDLVAGILHALADAETAAAELAAAETHVGAARARLVADDDLVRTARARLASGDATSLELVMAVRDAVEASGALREAVVAAARARVAAARAAGWPGPEVAR